MNTAENPADEQHDASASEPTRRSGFQPGNPYRWKPGQTGNPGGKRKGASFAAALARQAVAPVTDRDEMLKIAQTIGLDPAEAKNIDVVAALFYTVLCRLMVRATSTSGHVDERLVGMLQVLLRALDPAEVRLSGPDGGPIPIAAAVASVQAALGMGPLANASAALGTTPALTAHAALEISPMTLQAETPIDLPMTSPPVCTDHEEPSEVDIRIDNHPDERHGSINTPANDRPSGDAVSYHLKAGHRLSNQNRPGLWCVVYLTLLGFRKLPVRRRLVLFRCGRAGGSSFR